jgi:hypothetical protein
MIACLTAPCPVFGIQKRFVYLLLFAATLAPTSILMRLHGGRLHAWRSSLLALVSRSTSISEARAAAGFQRVWSDQFPATDTRVDFDTAPSGRRFGANESVERAYVVKGVSLSTSIRTSYVGVNNYVVEGRSHGRSAATVSPVWQGEITLSFNEPGHPERSAAVSRFGLWVADVLPGGTRLVALGADGSEAGSVTTTAQGAQFLGFRSDTPIHAVRVVPDKSIDPNYAIDDLVFDPPRATSRP